MSSSRKRGAIAKANAEVERLRQELMLVSYHRDIYKGVAEELARREGRNDDGFTIRGDEKLAPTVIIFYSQLLKDSGRLAEAAAMEAVATEKRKALNGRATNDANRPGDGLSRRSAQG